MLLFALACALFTRGLAAQAPGFEARLVQEGTAAPIAGATVSIVGASGTVRTGDGRFVWAPVPTVSFQIIVALPDGLLGVAVVIETVRNGTSIPIRASATSL